MSPDSFCPAVPIQRNVPVSQVDMFLARSIHPRILMARDGDGNESECSESKLGHGVEPVLQLARRVCSNLPTDHPE